jgi:hypothetical protein
MAAIYVFKNVEKEKRGCQFKIKISPPVADPSNFWSKLQLTTKQRRNNIFEGVLVPLIEYNKNMFS